MGASIRWVGLGDGVGVVGTGIGGSGEGDHGGQGDQGWGACPMHTVRLCLVEQDLEQQGVGVVRMLDLLGVGWGVGGRV